MRRDERGGYSNGTQRGLLFTTAVLGVGYAASIRQTSAQLSGMEQRMTAVTTTCRLYYFNMSCVISRKAKMQTRDVELDIRYIDRSIFHMT